MKIVFTKHAEDKLALLPVQLQITKEDVVNVIKNPEHIDEESDYPKTIVSRPRGTKHILRVVIKQRGDIITVITFYPAKKGRYYEN